MFAVELSKMRGRGIELRDRKNKRAQHPGISGTHILGLILQSRFQIEAARRKHAGVIDRFAEQRAQGCRHGGENYLLITGRKLRRHAEESAYLAAWRDCLNAFLVFKCAL